MQLNPYSEDNYSFILRKGMDVAKSFRYLLPGEYVYEFFFSNVSNHPFKLSVAVMDESERLFQQVYNLDKLIGKQTIKFKKRSRKVEASLALAFELLEGDNIKIYCPISLVKQTSVLVEDQEYLSIAEKVLTKFRQGGVPLQTHLEQIAPVSIAEYFKGCISLSEAERQLDEVIFNKLFITTDSSLFQKWKKRIYRKFLTKVYKKLTKNTERKRYFAKFYRNYVNSNYISENLEKRLKNYS